MGAGAREGKNTQGSYSEETASRRPLLDLKFQGFWLQGSVGLQSRSPSALASLLDCPRVARVGLLCFSEQQCSFFLLHKVKLKRHTKVDVLKELWNVHNTTRMRMYLINSPGLIAGAGFWLTRKHLIVSKVFLSCRLPSAVTKSVYFRIHTLIFAGIRIWCAC